MFPSKKNFLRSGNLVASLARALLKVSRNSKANEKAIKIAFDGGAFQQGLAAGIYNVAVGLINTIGKQRPEISFTLITDPRLGGCNEKLLNSLSIRPDILELDIETSESKGLSEYYSEDPKITFEVDGATHVPIRQGNKFIYRGRRPSRTFCIVSRADRPKYTGAGDDPRKLGISLARIEINNGDIHSTLALDDHRLIGGLYASEGSWRWTDGRAIISPDIFYSDSVEILIEIAGTTRYRIREEAGGPSFLSSAHLIDPNITKEQEAFESKLFDIGIDLYMANHFIPLNFKRIPTIAINYDVIPALFPQYFTPDAVENFADNINLFKRAQHIFSISSTSRKDLIRLTGRGPLDVTSIGIDIDPCFKRIPAQEISRVRADNGLGTTPYIICVGTLEPRKNHRRLIEAYSSLGKTVHKRCNLVIVGKTGWGSDGLRKLVYSHNLSENIRFLNNVTNDHLSALYSGALFCVYPSLYEGFGLPILEAMACGCPVLTSNVSSMPEVAGDAALYVDPASSDSIRDGLLRMINDDDLRSTLARKGVNRRRAFDWNLTANRVLAVLDRL